DSALSAEPRLGRAGIFVDHPDFEVCRAAENVLGAGGVLHARELHHYPVRTLLLDDRLGDAELVDTVAPGRCGVRARTTLIVFLCFRLERREEPQLAAAARFLQGQVAVGLLDRGACLGAL